MGLATNAQPTLIYTWLVGQIFETSQGFEAPNKCMDVEKALAIARSAEYEQCT
jgi:hypothetical protein